MTEKIKGRRRHRGRIIVLSLFLVLAVAGGAVGLKISAMRNETVRFVWKESSRAIVNPARGFYMQLYHDADPEYMPGMVKDGRVLAMITMDLRDHLTRDIPDKDMALLKRLLEAARENGVMVFFRGSYKQDDSMAEPSLEQIHRHIKQLSAMLNSYKDVVLMVQAGMIGLWGEWHSSIYLQDDQALMTQAAKVVRWWLKELDEEILLNLRRPSYIQKMEKAGIDTSRIGFHNDGLLGSGNDLGTYPDREADLTWCEKTINGRFNGGEMPYVNDLTAPSNVVKEFDLLSVSYLNVYYNTEVLDDWKSREYYGENAYDYIERHLGYRYYVSNVTANRYIFPDQEQIHLAFDLENSGFSSIVSRFHPFLVVERGGEKSYIPLENTSAEKNLESYEADVPMSRDEPMRIGVCYTDAENPQNSPNSHFVEFAQEGNVYEDHVNYFLKIQKDLQWKELLCPVQISE